MNYEPTIGLEIHTELKTKTKMFCGCLNDPEERHPNVNVCPICLGHPGTLPVINKSAVEAVLKLGLALNGKIPEISKFDRKNYFYPDLPKGYQISQYDKPLVLGGELNGVRLTRIHLEEDTGRLIHEAQSTKHKSQDNVAGYMLRDSSLVDFNRAGVPLMELVTEPDLHNAEDTVKFAKELQLIMRYLGISDADMEKGQMRVEVNISLMPTNLSTNSTNDISEIGDQVSVNSRLLGTKVEIKNLNSFRVVGEAIDFEIKRQTEHLEKGGEIKHETRGWDDVKKHTVSQRTKEKSHDYRYFPEPDLPPLDLSKFNLEKLRIEVPELPAQKRNRFVDEYNLLLNQVEILVNDRYLAQYFEEAASELKDEAFDAGYQTLFNYLSSDLLGLLNKEGFTIADLKIRPVHLAHLAATINKGELSSRMAKDILLEMYKTGLDPHEIVKEKRISQISDEDSVRKAVEAVIAQNPEAVADVKKGKQNAVQFLIGKTMAKLKGQGNPGMISKLLNEELTNL